MSRFHNSPSAERLALGWHWLGLSVSLLSLALAAGGVWWHWWAIQQHRKHLEDLGYDAFT